MDSKNEILVNLIRQAAKLTPEQLQALTKTAENRASGMEWKEAAEPVEQYMK